MIESNPEEVRINVKDQIFSNDKLSESGISVDIEGDDIVLYGDVESIESKWLAEEIAYNVRGVIHVTNYLNVAPLLH